MKTIKYKYIILFLFTATCSLFSNQIKIYQDKAEKLELHKDRYWQLLLHMPNEISEIDDSKFFISKNGKYNAKDELDETIKALLNETDFGDESFACRFPARKEWLKKNLDIKELPSVNCKEFDKIIKRLDPQSATLVFSSAHINSPASMFGHTLLRINSSYDSRLLSYAVNYAASVDQDTENGMLFAIKGLVGGYQGRYSLLPYYDKLKEYTNTEQRDIWEYDLNLNKDEVMQMVRHIWELNDIYSDYYFFDENCSYNILWLLEVARSSARLRDDFLYHVNPPETIFTIEKENLIDKINYRPSKRTILLEYEDLLNKKEKEIAKSLALGKLELEDIGDKKDYNIKLLLEAAIELSEYYYIENIVKQEDYLKIFHKLSSARSKLGIGQKINIKQPSNPNKGHNTARITLQNEYKNHKNSQLIGIRPAYHDIEDNDTGFLQGTQIEFLNVLFRYEDKKFDLEELKLLTIASYAERSEFFKPYSWKANFAWNKEYLNEERYFTASVGAGYTWSNPLGYNYFLVEPILYAASRPIIGLGATAGATLYEGQKLKTNLDFSQKFYDNGEKQFAARITQSWQIERNIALQLKYDYIQRLQKDSNGVKLVLNYFF